MCADNFPFDTTFPIKEPSSFREVEDKFSSELLSRHLKESVAEDVPCTLHVTEKGSPFLCTLEIRRFPLDANDTVWRVIQSRVLGFEVADEFESIDKLVAATTRLFRGYLPNVLVITPNSTTLLSVSFWIKTITPLFVSYGTELEQGNIKTLTTGNELYLLMLAKYLESHIEEALTLVNRAESNGESLIEKALYLSQRMPYLVSQIPYSDTK